MRTYRVAVLPGDGIGPEVTAAAVKVMDRAAKLYDVSLDYREVMVGGIAIDSTGEPLPDITIQSCKIAQAVLFGTVGGSKWDEQPRKLRPEYSIINLRRALNVQTYIRPCKVDFALAGLSPLRRRITSAGIDFILIRDLSGLDSYTQANTQITTKNGVKVGNPADYDVLHYTDEQVRQVAVRAFEMARLRPHKKLTYIAKANILASSRVWRRVLSEVAKNYPEVDIEFLYFDNGIHQLILNPDKFDIIVADNLLGDFISEVAGAFIGSPALAPSAALGAPNSPGIFGGIHGSAEHLAGQDICNPIAAILSAGLLMRYGLNEPEVAQTIERAVERTFEQGYRTADLIDPYHKNPTERTVGTTEMTEAILANIAKE